MRTILIIATLGFGIALAVAQDTRPERPTTDVRGSEVAYIKASLWDGNVLLYSIYTPSGPRSIRAYAVWNNTLAHVAVELELTGSEVLNFSVNPLARQTVAAPGRGLNMVLDSDSGTYVDTNIIRFEATQVGRTRLSVLRTGPLPVPTER